MGGSKHQHVFIICAAQSFCSTKQLPQMSLDMNASIRQEYQQPVCILAVANEGGHQPWEV